MGCEHNLGSPREIKTAGQFLMPSNANFLALKNVKSLLHQMLVQPLLLKRDALSLPLNASLS